MMKKEFFLVIILSLIIITSCNKILNPPVRDGVTEEEFFQNASDLDLAVNRLYNNLPGVNLYLNEKSSDNFLVNNEDDRMTGSRIVPTGRGSGGWSWSQLRSINWILNNISRVDADPDIKAKYRGISRWFRAYFYFEKIQRFGDVPWYNQVLNSDDSSLLKKERTPRKVVMDSVMADLDYAIANIPDEIKLFQITRSTALALKSRAALFAGTYRKYHGLDDYKDYLTQAAEAAKELIDSHNYSLYTEGGPNQCYRMLFARNNQDKTETILANEYDKSIKNHSLGAKLSRGSWVGFGPTQDLVNSYLMADGSRFTDKPGYKTMGFYDAMKNRDPRLTQTIAGPNFTVLDETTPEPVNFDITNSGYRLIKALPPKSQWGDGGSYIDIIIMRYAEVLLNYAEAKAELGNLTQNDLDISVNLLRDRVGMPHLNLSYANNHPDNYLESEYPNVDKGSFEGVILEIRRERRIELVNESFRWNDLMRWKEGKKIEQPMVGLYFPHTGAFDFNNDGTADVYVYRGDPSGIPSSVTASINIDDVDLRDPITGQIGGNSGNIVGFLDGKFIEPKDYLYPIPKEDLELNPNLKQNPGW